MIINYIYLFIKNNIFINDILRNKMPYSRIYKFLSFNYY